MHYMLGLLIVRGRVAWFWKRCIGMGCQHRALHGNNSAIQWALPSHYCPWSVSPHAETIALFSVHLACMLGLLIVRGRVAWFWKRCIGMGCQHRALYWNNSAIQWALPSYCPWSVIPVRIQ